MGRYTPESRIIAPRRIFLWSPICLSSPCQILNLPESLHPFPLFCSYSVGQHSYSLMIPSLHFENTKLFWFHRFIVGWQGTGPPVGTFLKSHLSLITIILYRTPWTSSLILEWFETWRVTGVECTYFASTKFTCVQGMPDSCAYYEDFNMPPASCPHQVCAHFTHILVPFREYVEFHFLDHFTPVGPTLRNSQGLNTGRRKWCLSFTFLSFLRSLLTTSTRFLRTTTKLLHNHSTKKCSIDINKFIFCIPVLWVVQWPSWL